MDQVVYLLLIKIIHSGKSGKYTILAWKLPKANLSETE